jgi:hypothetical protein
VTGWEVLKEIAGEGIVKALDARGFVCVPRVPTKEMLSGAYYDALEEDARGVWDKMVGVSEGRLTEEGIPKAKA